MSTLQRRLLMMIAPPLLALLAVTPFLILPPLAALRTATQTHAILDLLTSGTRSLHTALVRERTLSVAFLAGGGVQAMQELTASREETDRLRAQVATILEASTEDQAQAGLREAVERLAELTAIRAQIDRAAIPPAEAPGLYDPLVLGLRQPLIVLLQTTASQLDPKRAQTLANLIELEGALGSEIAFGLALIHRGFFEPEAYRRLIGAKARSERLIEMVRATAEATGKPELAAIVTAFTADGFRTLSMILERASEVKTIQGVDAGRWSELGETVLARIAGADRAILGGLRDLADSERRAALLRLAGAIGGILAVLAVSFLFALRGIRAVSRLEEEERQARAAAESERRRAIEELSGRFGREFGTLVDGIRELARELAAHARTVDGETHAVSAESETVATVTRRTSSNVGTIAAACEELAASAREIAEQISRSSTMTREVAGRVQQTDRTMDELAAMAEKIGEIVGLIADIAEKTNLLALNATIEAARAGEAGRGFAVVAQEVKALAGQTAEATRQIADQVGTVQKAARGAVGAINEVRVAMDDLDRIAAAVAAAVEEQNAAIADVARNAQEAAGGTEEIAQRTETMSGKAQQARARSAAMTGLVDETNKRTEALAKRLEQLLASLRAAA